MDYKKRIHNIRITIRDKKIIKFVEFLDVLFEWIDSLKKTKRLSNVQEKEITQQHLIIIFKEIEKFASSAKITPDTYDYLKRLLLSRTSDFLIQIITKTKVRMVDFDIVQFNLYSIFGKEEIASMVEHIRDSLESIILEQKAKEQEKKEIKKREEEEWIRKLNEIPKIELNKIIMGSMFDFKPSARTHEERDEAIRHNQILVGGQKKIFRNFELKLADATESARVDAQNTAFRKIVEVKRHMGIVVNSFQEKAKIFVSEEGPKKMIIHSRETIDLQKKKLHRNLKGKGRAWKKEFRLSTIRARDRILTSKKKLDYTVAAKGVEWKKGFNIKTRRARDYMHQNISRLDKEIMVKGKEWKEKFTYQTDKARTEIDHKTSNLLAAERITKGFISERGASELKGARERILKGRSEFEGDVRIAEKLFSGTAEEIGKSRSDFAEKRDIAAYKFTERGIEVETEIYGTLYKEKKRLGKEKEIAREKFNNKAYEIKGQAFGHITSKKEIFANQREKAGKKFLLKSEKIRGKQGKQGSTFNLPEGSSKESEAKASLAKGRIENEHLNLMAKAKINREKMKEEVMHRRDLFLYDVKFAKHRMQKHAKIFAEKSASKREEFETRQGQVIARHKAHQKSHIIRNLLRTIRSMQTKA